MEWFFEQPRSPRVASDCMRSDAPVVFLETLLTDLVDHFARTNTQHASVLDDGRVVSVITVRELIRYTSKMQKSLAKILSKPAQPTTAVERKLSKQHTPDQVDHARKQSISKAVHSRHELFSPHLPKRTQIAKPIA